jgi:hypothetical protein
MSENIIEERNQNIEPPEVKLFPSKASSGFRAKPLKPRLSKHFSHFNDYFPTGLMTKDDQKSQSPFFP